jgi:toxin ParE1/3/4
MKVRFAPRAHADLRNIGDYIGERNPVAAQRVMDDIGAALHILERSPNVGRRQSRGPFRKLVTNKYRYLIFYSVNDVAKEVIVTTIQHPARRRRHHDA